MFLLSVRNMRHLGAERFTSRTNISVTMLMKILSVIFKPKEMQESASSSAPLLTLQLFSRPHFSRISLTSFLWSAVLFFSNLSSLSSAERRSRVDGLHSLQTQKTSPRVELQPRGTFGSVRPPQFDSSRTLGV